MIILSKTKRLTEYIKTTINKDVIFTLANSVWKIVSGPLTMIFIPLFLTAQTQGFWYTFVSLAALTVFADLGFTTIVTQFSSHEYASLKFNEQTKQFEGDEDYIKRLGSLLRFVINWAFKVSMIGFPIILAIGIFMFNGKSTQVNWLFPWIIYVFSSGISFSIGVVLSFLEGCNQIAAIQKNRIVASMTSTVSTLVFLYFNFSLYAIAITAIIGTMVNCMLLYLRFKKPILQIFSASKDFVVNWRKDFFRLLWRYAISWSSGYFIFQIYTPLMFQFHGPVEAGKVGISLALVTAAFSIANVHIYVANPKLNAFASLKNWKAMDALFFKNLTLSFATFLTGTLVVLLTIYFYGNKISFLNRFLGIIPLTMLFLAWSIQLVINGLAVYLRAHKQEPLVLLSVMSAVFIAISTVLVTKFLAADYLFIGFLVAVILGLPVTIWIFIRKRKEWHV